nr:MAG TPA: Head Tail Connector Protein [Caudoviricetes sp.]
MPYITYSEYVELGGSADQTTFSSLIYTVEAKLNYYTNNRLNRLDEIPRNVKMLCTKLVDTCNNAQVGQKDVSLSSYNNGIESFGYSAGVSNSAGGSTGIDNVLYQMIKEFLSENPELLYRGRVQWKREL